MVTGKYSFLCSWAGPGAGLRNETLCTGEEEAMAGRGGGGVWKRRGLEHQRGRDRVVTGSLRTGPQVAIATNGTPTSHGNSNPLSLWLPMCPLAYN